MGFDFFAWLMRLFTRAPKSTLDSGDIWFGGGNGDTVDNAIIVRGAQFDLVGTYAEFGWLARVHGQKDRDWTLISHSHEVRGGRDIDTFILRLTDGTSRTVYFDCTESFGKPLPASLEP